MSIETFQIGLIILCTAFGYGLWLRAETRYSRKLKRMDERCQRYFERWRNMRRDYVDQIALLRRLISLSAPLQCVYQNKVGEFDVVVSSHMVYIGRAEGQPRKGTKTFIYHTSPFPTAQDAISHILDAVKGFQE